MGNCYLNKRRLGTTLLPSQQKFCDNQMYFMLDHQYAEFQSNLTWLSNHMTSQILLDAQVFFPQITLIWPSLNLRNSGMRKHIEKR